LNLVYILLVAALGPKRGSRVDRGTVGRIRRKSRLQLRLTGVFAVEMAFASDGQRRGFFAGLTINAGSQGLASQDRVRSVVGNSLAAAEAYENEQAMICGRMR